MARVRTFRLYDLKFFLEKENSYYCLSNRVRFTRNQISLLNYFLDSFKLVASESMAVCLSSTGNYHWCGDVNFDLDNSVAWFNWLIASKNASNANLSELLEFMIHEAGQAGMYTCAVVLDEGQWVSSAFRQLGFGVYARQTVWSIKNAPQVPAEPWEQVSIEPFDEYDRFYESQITPPIRQLGSNWGKGSIYALKKEGAIQATAKVSTDHAERVYIEPIFDPGVENPAKWMISLADRAASLTHREIRVLIPGYQAWVSDAFAAEGFQPECRQTVFVKHLTVKPAEEQEVIPLEQKVLQPIGSRQYSTTKKAE